MILQNPDTSVPKGSSLHKCYYRILIQVVQKDLDTEILLQMSCGFTFASRRCTLTHTHCLGSLSGIMFLLIPQKAGSYRGSNFSFPKKLEAIGVLTSQKAASC